MRKFLGFAGGLVASLAITGVLWALGFPVFIGLAIPLGIITPVILI